MPIELIPGGAAGAIAKVGGVATAGAAPGAGAFAESLQKMLGQVEKTAGDANAAVGNMLDKTGDVHDAMIALQRAEMSLQLTVQVRNKLVQAYQDIMRMPV
jgi:flagellar hook-basal body complex protein FliE